MGSPFLRRCSTAHSRFPTAPTNSSKKNKKNDDNNNNKKRKNIYDIIVANHNHTYNRLNVGSVSDWGWSGSAKMLGKLLVPGCPTDMDNTRARAYCAFTRCGYWWFGHFFARLSFPFSFSLFGGRPDINRNNVSKGR